MKRGKVRAFLSYFLSFISVPPFLHFHFLIYISVCGLARRTGRRSVTPTSCLTLFSTTWLLRKARITPPPTSLSCNGSHEQLYEEWVRLAILGA